MNLKKSGEGFPGRLRGRKGKGKMLELYYSLKNKFLKNVENSQVDSKSWCAGVIPSLEMGTEEGGKGVTGGP